MNKKYQIIYKVNRKKYINDSIYLKVEEISPLNFVINTTQEVELVSAKIYLDYDKTCSLFCNGFQTWTDTGVYHYGQSTPHMRILGKLVNNIAKPSCVGDYEWCKQDKLVSHTYTYLEKDGKYHLYGALNERTGFTSFHFKKRLEIHKDVQKVILQKGQHTLFDIYEDNGTLDSVIKNYFKALGISPCTTPTITGYTSWYRHYQDITEEKLNNDLAGLLSNKQYKPDLFQIDDGYQQFVGDWLKINPNKFPNGLEPVIKKVIDAKLIPGLWLAPFIAEKNSDLRREHPDWIVCKGALNWSGMYHLDITNPEVKAYLHEVFAHYKEMGIKFFKLDFLYAAAYKPMHGKSRAQIMYEAMDFLREELQGYYILGCGVPLGSAFGKVDYCRIGQDVTLNYDGLWYMRLVHRERTSTKLAIRNTRARYHLDGVAFGNDPDVFILRKTDLTEAQRKELFETNIHHGSLILCSDDMSKYNDEQWQQIEEVKKIVKQRNKK